MKIVHDFFSIQGGGENLILSFAKELKLCIHTAFYLKKNDKNKVIQSKINFLLCHSKVLVFLYYRFFFKIKTDESILFSGTHCCYSIRRCISPKKILYAHSLPKSLFVEIYQGYKKNFFSKFMKKKNINDYFQNLLSLDYIFFNSNKTRLKFLKVFPSLEKKIQTKVLYPYSNMSFIKSTSIKKSKKLYIVLNSRHQVYKNFLKILDQLNKFLLNNKNFKVYITQSGNLSSEIKNLYKNNDQLIFKGFLNLESYEKLLLNSLCVLFPSNDEDFGISALDAYNLNIPIIINKNCGFSELLDHDYKFFFDNEIDFYKLISRLKSYKYKNFYKNRINLKYEFIYNIRKYIF